MRAAAAKRLCRRQWQGGARTRQQTIQLIIRSAVKNVPDELAPSPRVLFPFTPGLDLFEYMVVATAAAKYFHGRQRRVGAKKTISPFSLFWFCRNARSGDKSKAILQCSD